MKKNTYIITVVACLISYTSFAQTKFEKFDSKEFYTEYVEPLNGIELGTGEINDLLTISMLHSMNENAVRIINQYKTKTGVFDATKNVDYSNPRLAAALAKGTQMYIDLLAGGIEDCMNWMELLDEHKKELPKEYYNKRMKELDETIANISTAKTYYETLL